MKKALVNLVSILAVIMPLSALGAEMTHFDLVPVRLIELDDQHARITGTSGLWLRQNLGPVIRQSVMDTDLVQFAVSGKQFQAITASQKRIQSANYRKSSQELVPSGMMIAPTEQCSVTGNAFVRNVDEGAGITAIASLFGGHRRGTSQVRGRVIKKVATVTLTLEVYDISTGTSASRSYTAEESASERTTLSVSGSKLGRFGGMNLARRTTDQELIWQAAEKAIRNLRDQLARDFESERICEGIDIASGKAIWKKGQVITYYRNDRPIAKYEVLTIRGNTLFVRILKQDQLPKAGDPFKIK